MIPRRFLSAAEVLWSESTGSERKTSDLVHPVLHGSVAHALVECIRGQDQDEVTCPLYTLNQFVLEFTGLQLLHVYEDAVSSDLQVHLQKAWDSRENEKF